MSDDPLDLEISTDGGTAVKIATDIRRHEPHAVEADRMALRRRREELEVQFRATPAVAALHRAIVS